ncbi:hypothetical protein Hanom_Chr16g01437481 [Helianthus anomalus]
MGIYEDWSIVSHYVLEPVTYKKFGSLLQEATRYSAECGKNEIPLKVTIIREPLKSKKKERIIEFKKTFSKPFVNEEKEEKDTISLVELKLELLVKMISNLSISIQKTRLLKVLLSFVQHVSRRNKESKKKNFRKKIVAAKDTNIFIKCNSTLPDWYQGTFFQNYHHLEIGLAKARTVNPLKETEYH